MTEVLGDEYLGAVVADFHGGYNVHSGVEQRCWVHFDRDLDELKDKYVDDAGVGLWVDSALDVYYRAKATVEMDYTDDERRLLRWKFEAELLSLAKPYLSLEDAAQHVLAKRIDKFLDELFVFVEYPHIPSENNAAERAIRPAVIARKVSGGTRSAKGSKAKSVLMSLFGTWGAQGMNTYHACKKMIIHANKAKLASP